MVVTAPAVSAQSEAPVVPLWRWMLGGLLPPLLFLSVVALTAISPPPATEAEALAQASKAWTLGRLFRVPFPGHLLVPGMTSALAFLLNFFFLQRLRKLRLGRAIMLLVTAPFLMCLALLLALAVSLAGILLLMALLGHFGFDLLGLVSVTPFVLIFNAVGVFSGAVLGTVVALFQWRFAPPPLGRARITWKAHLWGGAYAGLIMSVLFLAWPFLMGLAFHWSYDVRYLLPVLAFVTVPHILLTHRAFRSCPPLAFPDILPVRQFFLRLAVLGSVIVAPALLKASGLF